MPTTVMSLIDVQLAIVKIPSATRVCERAGTLQPVVDVLAVAFVAVAAALGRFVLVVVGVVRPVVVVGTMVAVVLVDVHDGAFTACVVVCGGEGGEGEEEDVADGLSRSLAEANSGTACTNREMYGELGVCDMN